MKHAIHCYSEWGAVAKVEQLTGDTNDKTTYIPRSFSARLFISKQMAKYGRPV